MTTHTPGPWKTDGRGINVYDSTGALIGSMDTREHARTAAAAPELLKGLHLAVDRLKDIYVTSGIKSDEVRDALRDIIAKAEGK